MASALEGIKVLELAQAVAVPVAGRLLADYGADVIHIEHPVRGDLARTWGLMRDRPLLPTEKQTTANYQWENICRNKRGMTLDVSQQVGQQILHKLVETADVFVTNLRPEERDRYYLTYQTMSQINPKLIYASITGVGQKGPEKDLPTYDHTIYWARAGWCHRLAPKGQIIGVKAAEGFGDTVVAMVLAYGIMTALYVRQQTGLGQEVDTSLLHTGIFHNGQDLSKTCNDGEDLQLSDRQTAGALTNCYQTKDGRYLRLGFVRPDRYLSRFCKAIEREDLENDPRFKTVADKSKNAVALIAILDEVFRGRTLAEWKTRLPDDVPWAPVQNMPEVCNDAQAEANNVFSTFAHPFYGPVRVINAPVNLSKTPAQIRSLSPELGQHTEDILLEAGYTWEDIGRFKEQRIIA
ncbi:MAG: CoA transferase [Chloroflexi bacterium]|nr:CoA transferase [Chloroflexota bacterium]